MAGKMRIRAKLKGEECEVKALMRHPMETGLRKDADGNTIPAHFIGKVTATSEGRTLMIAHWGAAVSQNPFLAFRFNGASAGQEVVLSWEDNQGNTSEGRTKIK